MTTLIPKLECLIAPQAKAFFILAMNTQERVFLASPHTLSVLYGHVVAEYPDVRDIYVVDEDVFQFLYNNENVTLLQYS